MTKSDRNKVWIGILVVLLVIVGAVLLFMDDTTTGSETIKVGFMAPLSGEAATYGESALNAVKLAKKEMGLDNVEIVTEDSKCDGAAAVISIRKLTSIDKVSAIVGEMCSGATIPAAPIANEKQTPMLSPSSTSADLTTAGDYFFRTVPSDALQGKFGAEYVFGKGKKKIAILYGNEEYGVGFNKVLKEEFPKLGGEIVASEAFESSSVDLRTQITKIKDADPEAIYIITNSMDSMVASLQQIKELGLDVLVVGSEGFKSDEIIGKARAAAEGLRVTSVSVGTAEFRAKHKLEMGVEPGPFAAQAYDAFKVKKNL